MAWQTFLSSLSHPLLIRVPSWPYHLRHPGHLHHPFLLRRDSYLQRLLDARLRNNIYGTARILSRI